MTPLWAIGTPAVAQDAITVQPQVVSSHEAGMDISTVGGGAGTVGGIVGLVLLLERIGLIRIPRRDSERAPAPSHEAATHMPPCTPLQALQQQVAGLEARQQERQNATAATLAQIRDDASRESDRQRAGLERLAVKLDDIADRIPRD